MKSGRISESLLYKGGTEYEEGFAEEGLYITKAEFLSGFAKDSRLNPCVTVANDPAYREMEGDTYDLIAQHIKTNELMQVKRYEKKEGKIDMCGAIAELMERARREGIEQGIKALIETSAEYGSTKEETIERIIKKVQITNDAAELYVNKYW